jgi:hypothetical protein
VGKRIVDGRFGAGAHKIYRPYKSYRMNGITRQYMFI